MLNISISIPYSIFMPRVALTSIAARLFPASRQPGTVFHIMSTMLLVVSAFWLALFVEDLGAVFSLVGAVASAALAYVVPPLMMLRLERGSPWDWRKVYLLRF